MLKIVEAWKVPSQSSNATYTVARYEEGSFACSCPGWTKHFPRKDCKHIMWVVAHGPTPIEPLLLSLIQVNRKAERKLHAKAA